jgi:NADPH:quinone reductase-like Zn-dependent oxidoreductase
MRAAIQDRYGPPEVLRVGDIARPAIGEGQVLVRIVASTVSQTDTHVRGAHPFFWRLIGGFRRPRWPCLGVEFAGIVEEVAPGVSAFAVGNEVFGQANWFGAHAEYLAVRADGTIARKPANVSFETAAAACDGGCQALDTLRKAQAGPGRRIVVYGASGSLGTAAVQLGKHLGAHVTGVCGPTHVDLVRSLGADEVIDYPHEDFSARGPIHDAVIDAVGKTTFLRSRRALRPGGIFVATDGGPYLESLVLVIPSRFVGSRRLTFAMGRRIPEDVRLFRDLMESGVYRPVVDRTYPLDAVAEAHRYVETWRKTGNVVLRIRD